MEPVTISNRTPSQVWTVPAAFNPSSVIFRRPSRQLKQAFRFENSRFWPDSMVGKLHMLVHDHRLADVGYAVLAYRVLSCASSSIWRSRAAQKSIGVTRIGKVDRCVSAF
jgi:hypothetical protein